MLGKLFTLDFGLFNDFFTGSYHLHLTALLLLYVLLSYGLFQVEFSLPLILKHLMTANTLDVQFVHSLIADFLDESGEILCAAGVALDLCLGAFAEEPGLRND